MSNKNKYKNGFGILGAIILILVLGAITASGLYVYNNNSTKDETTNTGDGTKAKSHTVLAVGDIACDPSNPNFNNGNGQNGACMHRTVFGKMAEENPEYVLLLGDLQYQDATLEKFEKSFIPAWPNADSQIISAVGNHEYITKDALGYIQAFNKYFPNAKYEVDGKRYFKSSIGNWDVYTVDSNCPFIGGCGESTEQYKWLESNLKSSKSKCSLMMMHHPAFTSGKHRNDGGIDQAKSFYELFDEYGGDVVLAGHDHNYERFRNQNFSREPKIDSPRLFVIGTGGADLYQLNEPYMEGHEYGSVSHGYLRLDIDDSIYYWQQKEINGNVLDSGRQECN